MTAQLLIFLPIAVVVAVSAEINYEDPVNYAGKIVSCDSVDCIEGFKCEEGTEICSSEPPCVMIPTMCVPVDNEEQQSAGGSGSGYGSGFGEDDSGEPVDCPPNMFSSECGPRCPTECGALEPSCDDVKCPGRHKCVCVPGHVMLQKDDPSYGCVPPEECPKPLTG